MVVLRSYYIILAQIRCDVHYYECMKDLLLLLIIICTKDSGRKEVIVIVVVIGCHVGRV